MRGKAVRFWRGSPVNELQVCASGRSSWLLKIHGATARIPTQRYHPRTSATTPPTIFARGQSLNLTRNNFGHSLPVTQNASAAMS